MIPNGTFTFTNTSGEHRTFQIKTQGKDCKFAPGKRIAALLRGPDSMADYTGFGFIENDQVVLWRSKQNSVAFKAYAKLLNLLGQFMETGSEDIKGRVCFTHNGKDHVYDYSGSKRCLVCNRQLTDPESIRLMIGPVCREGAAA